MEESALKLFRDYLASAAHNGFDYALMVFETDTGGEPDNEFVGGFALDGEDYGFRITITELERY